MLYGLGCVQVKLRGFRIELGEVEAAILAVPGIVETVVTLVTGSLSGQQQLVGYYAPDNVDASLVRC